MPLGLFVRKWQPKVGLAGYDMLFTYFVVEAENKHRRLIEGRDFYASTDPPCHKTCKNMFQGKKQKKKYKFRMNFFEKKSQRKYLNCLF